MPGDRQRGRHDQALPCPVAALDKVSAPAPAYPDTLHRDLRTMLRFAGATVDGTPSAVYPPLLQSAVRY